MACNPIYIIIESRLLCLLLTKSNAKTCKDFCYFLKSYYKHRDMQLNTQFDVGVKDRGTDRIKVGGTGIPHTNAYAQYN